MLKSLSVSEKMCPGDTNVCACNIIDKSENGWDNLHPMCLVDFPSNYVSKKADDLLIESFKSKSLPLPPSNIDDDKLIQI